METEYFWAGGLFSVLALIAICVTLVCMNSNAAIVAMVDKGADPIAAMCAINGSERGMCTAYIATHPK